jgi:TRAP-type C4-dicarboxylate transport system permease small subunit
MPPKPRTIVARLSVFLGRACGGIYLVAVILSVTEVFSRYVLNAPTVWITEVVMTLCGCAWLLSVGAVTQQNRHITVTAMQLIVGKRTWRRLSQLAFALTFTAIIALLYASLDPAVRATLSVERTGSAFNSPTPTMLKVLLAVSCALYLAQLIANLFEDDDSVNDTEQPGGD